MKITFTVILLFSTILASFSQSENIFGEYVLKLGNEKHRIKRTLNLNEDGTFTFHNYSDVKNGIPQVTSKFGKGAWSIKGKVISFFTDLEKDMDQNYTLDFNQSRARVINKHSRDNSESTVEARLLFFESKIFWLKRMEMFKIRKRTF